MANGNLKAEIEVGGGLRKKKDGLYVILVGTLKPLVFTFDLKVSVSKTDWSPEIEMLNVNYVKNLTIEQDLWDPIEKKIVSPK